MDAPVTGASLANIREDMDQLADHLATMIKYHADDPAVVASLRRAQAAARRGATLTLKYRAQP